MRAENWKGRARQRETQAGTLKRKTLSKTRTGYTNKKQEFITSVRKLASRGINPFSYVKLNHHASRLTRLFEMLFLLLTFSVLLRDHEALLGQTRYIISPVSSGSILRGVLPLGMPTKGDIPIIYPNHLSWLFSGKA